MPGANGWTAQSAMVGGFDALDFGLQMKGGQNVTGVHGRADSCTDQLSGTLRDRRDARPPTTRSAVSERQALLGAAVAPHPSARPDTDGNYSVRGCRRPTSGRRGHDAEPGSWFDPAFLEQLSQASTPVTLNEGEKKTHFCASRDSYELQSRVCYPFFKA